MRSLAQFIRDLAASLRIFCLTPRCPYPSCRGNRFSWVDFEQHVQTHVEDVRDPAGRWARQTGDEA